MDNTARTKNVVAVKVCQKNLDSMPSNIKTPKYDRSKVTAGILHMSVGGFHRAHECIYMDNLIANEQAYEWGICGVGLRSFDKPMYEALSSQDCLFTVVERDADVCSPRIVGSMVEYLYAPEDPQAVIEKMADGKIKIVSLTVTEKGYCFDQVTGEFNPNHPDVQNDINNPENPQSVLAYITFGLKRCKEKGIKPFTVLCCDNVQGNGDVVRKMVLGFSALVDKELSEWIASEVSFPNTMVDRITPITTDEDRKLIENDFAILDAWPVVTEPFMQWVVEDNFCNDRPELEKVGVQFTDAVHNYEKMKICLLNSTHSAMAYLGYLAGHRYIHEIALDDTFIKFMQRLMDEEVTPLLPEVPGVNLDEYKKSIIERFANPTIKDQILRIAMDGSQKFPKFMFPSIEKQLDKGGPITMSCFAIAGWMRYLKAEDESGASIEIDDPMGDKLVELAKSGGNSPEMLLSIKEIFSDKLTNSEIFVKTLTKALSEIYELGAKKALEKNL